MPPAVTTAAANALVSSQRRPVRNVPRVERPGEPIGRRAGEVIEVFLECKAL
jgi:hypothetical protein